MKRTEIQINGGQRSGRSLLSLIGERNLVDVSQEHCLVQSAVESWKERLMRAGKHGLKAKFDNKSAHDDWNWRRFGPDSERYFSS